MLVVFIGIQFVRPARNQSGQVLPTDFVNTYTIPVRVGALVKGACYDCHSDNTDYPWYSNIQPVAWFMAGDVNDGKAKLNFSDFGSMSKRKQASRLQEIEMQLKNGSMPLVQYKLMHASARLSQDDIKLLVEWIEQTKDSLAQKR